MSDRADWADDDLDDEEFPDDEYSDDDNETSEVRSCPNCGADVYEDANRCPLCGEYVTFSTSPWSDRSWWWIALGLAGIAAVLCTLLAWNLIVVAF